MTQTLQELFLIRYLYYGNVKSDLWLRLIRIFPVLSYFLLSIFIPCYIFLKVDLCICRSQCRSWGRLGICFHSSANKQKFACTSLDTGWQGMELENTKAYTGKHRSFLLWGMYTVFGWWLSGFSESHQHRRGQPLPGKLSQDFTSLSTEGCSFCLYKKGGGVFFPYFFHQNYAESCFLHWSTKIAGSIAP